MMWHIIALDLANFVLAVILSLEQICLSFYEVKGKQAKWFGNKVERLYWEQWYINLNVVHPKTHSSHSNQTKVVADPGGTVLFSC